MSPELTRIFDELKALGVASITANYSGQGDSGQFDGITAHNADGSVLKLRLVQNGVHCAFAVTG